MSQHLPLRQREQPVSSQLNQGLPEKQIEVNETENSDDDCAEERLDCVHDIHSQRQRQQGRTSLLKQQYYEREQEEGGAQPRLVDDGEEEYESFDKVQGTKYPQKQWNTEDDIHAGVEEDIDDLVETRQPPPKLVLQKQPFSHGHQQQERPLYQQRVGSRGQNFEDQTFQQQLTQQMYTGENRRSRSKQNDQSQAQGHYTVILGLEGVQRKTLQNFNNRSNKQLVNQSPGTHAQTYGQNSAKTKAIPLQQPLTKTQRHQNMTSEYADLPRNQSAQKPSSRGEDFNAYHQPTGPNQYLATTQYGTKFLSGVVPAAGMKQLQPVQPSHKANARFALTQNNFYNPNSAGQSKHPVFMKDPTPQNNFSIRQGMRQQVRSRQKPGTNQLNSGQQTPIYTQQQQQSPYDNFGTQNQMVNQVMEAGRNTFYATDRQKQQLTAKPESRGAQRNPQNFGVHSATRQSAQVAPQLTNFSKPRALSRQADAHIKIEVHRDAKIYNYLQAEKQENMNLMFYDFNNCSAQNTGENFYQPNNGGGERPSESRGGPIQAQGDRVPTRERGGYRSANLNYRRRGGQTSTDRMMVHQDLMPPQGL